MLARLARSLRRGDFEDGRRFFYACNIKRGIPEFLKHPCSESLIIRIMIEDLPPRKSNKLVAVAAQELSPLAFESTSLSRQAVPAVR